MMQEVPFFLALTDVVNIHVNQIEKYGGQSGIRDLGLLQSALAMPQASFGGEWLHRDIYEMAAYAFHISQNHPFVNGNKRTGLACALVFLGVNGITKIDPERRLYQAMIDVTAGVLNKFGLAEVLKSLPGEH